MQLDNKVKDVQLRMENVEKTSLNLIIELRNTMNICSQFKMPRLSISFEDRINQAKENPHLIFVTEDQKVFFNDIVKEISVSVAFNDFIIEGFLKRSIRKWQFTYNQPIALATRMNQPEQLRIGIEILNYVKHLLSRAWYHTDKKLKTQLLEEIFRVIIELYEELLSVRSFMNNPENQESFLDIDLENWTQENESLV